MTALFIYYCHSVPESSSRQDLIRNPDGAGL
jgi:hypothetical protein